MPLNKQLNIQVNSYIKKLNNDIKDGRLIEKDTKTLSTVIQNIKEELANIGNLSEDIDIIIENIKKEKITVLQIPKKSYKGGPNFSRFIKIFNNTIDNITKTIELTNKQDYMIGKIDGFIPNNFVIDNNLLGSIQKKEIHDNIITKHKKMIIQELDYEKKELGQEFDTLLSTCIYSILNNATIENYYQIAIGEKDVIYDEIPELISLIYHKTKKDKIQKKIIEKIKNNDSFDIGETFIQNLKTFFKGHQNIKKPNNNFIRTTLKQFHEDFSEFIFTTELFTNEIIGETEELAYLLGHKDEASILTKTLIILKILDDDIIYKIFIAYLHLKFFLKTGKTKKQENNNKQENKEKENREKENREKENREKEKIKSIKQESQIKLTIIKKYIKTLDLNTEKYLLRLLTNKNQLYINKLNDKFQRGLSNDDIIKLTAECPTHFIIQNNLGDNVKQNEEENLDKNTDNDKDKKNTNEEKSLTQKKIKIQNTIKQYINNPKLFKAENCIKIFKELGYNFLNEKQFTYSFNKELGESLGEQRKKKLLEQLMKISKSNLNVWNIKKIRKVETININPGAYRLVKKDNKIRGIYNHDTYQRNVFVRSK